jgi:hypothetical protein
MTFRKSKFWSLLLAHLFFLAALGIHPIVMPPTVDAATQSILPYPRFKAFVTGTSDPLAGGKLYTYLPGGLVQTTTYTTSAGTVANANPVVLDANGEADVWFTGTIKLILTDSDNVTVWTKDNVGAVGSYGSLTGDGTGNISGFDNVTNTGYGGTLRSGDLITKGPWLDVRAYATIALADNAAVVAGRELWITDNVAISDNTTITAPVRVLKGGLFDIATGKILAFTSAYDAGNYRTFYGAGSIKFSSPTSISPVGPIKSVWWGY